MIKAQSYVQDQQFKLAFKELSSIQSDFEDPLLNLWLGILWIQVDNLRNASTVADRLSKAGSHHWILQVFISVHSQNTELVKMALDKIVFTDVDGVHTRNFHQTWVPNFNWNPLLKQADDLLKKGVLSQEYSSVLKWLIGESPSIINKSDGWATGWALQTQVAMEEERWEDAFYSVNRLRRLAPSERGAELMSQLINIQIGRPDISRRELDLFSQKDRDAVWFRWLSIGFKQLDELEKAAEYRSKIQPEVYDRNLSFEHPTIWDSLSND